MSKNTPEDTVDFTIRISPEMNDWIQIEAKKARRKRHAQVLVMLDLAKALGPTST